MNLDNKAKTANARMETSQNKNTTETHYYFADIDGIRTLCTLTDFLLSDSAKPLPA